MASAEYNSKYNVFRCIFGWQMHQIMVHAYTIQLPGHVPLNTNQTISVLTTLTRFNVVTWSSQIGYSVSVAWYMMYALHVHYIIFIYGYETLTYIITPSIAIVSGTYIIIHMHIGLTHQVYQGSHSSPLFMANNGA